jgi:hypothetical protein
MTEHDIRESERQALALAEGASPEARNALEQVLRAIKARADATPQAALRRRSQTLVAIGAGLAIFAAYLPVALWIGNAYVPVPRPPGRAIEALLRIDAYGGFTWRARSFTLDEYADGDSGDQHSPVILYENLTPLGPGHSDLADIARIGLGHFAHVSEEAHSGRPGIIKDYLFSTSDNSDPRTNGRHYWAVLPK